MLCRTEYKMVELKARADDLGQVRRKTLSLGAHHVDTIRQTDTYFKVPKGRLKLREVNGRDVAELVYYEREDIVGPKRSSVFILEIEKPTIFKSLLKKILETQTIVVKQREIYRYKGTQIHLDVVEKLGSFVEFERKVSSNVKTLNEDRQVLNDLLERLEIQRAKLEKLSYSDLAQNHNRK
ncbi:MAG: class IV adenylate cyclase [Candidatus Bathyarchaeota archaeon]|nr:MAG: class IV adenylate cyclase [Candidatus Bathyarchaeota archaeon]